MLRGLLTLTWLEIKIFLREPLGVIGTVGVPVLVFVLLGRIFAPRPGRSGSGTPDLMTIDLPILTAILIALSAILSLVTIIAIYREGGILKRLRATPLRSHTILTAHVLVKLLFTLITLIAMLLAGRRYYPVGVHPPYANYALALLIVTVSILTIGFLIASVVPTARFAQPVGALILYPMILLSGLFIPVDALPRYLQLISRVLPFTYGVSLLRGIWIGESWSAHLVDLGALALVFVVCTALSSRVFRWE
jgi:ABC-2 type transport system permease protein